ncbi:MAG: hypothetical protein HY226_01945 [Candidatus Vogelbacteria bacterium]|nr:hypothetical protein [Candidatus Vogelbacteria bacterium]
MEWIVVPNDHTVEFPNYLSVEDKIEVRKIKAAQLLEKITRKYPTMKVLVANVLGSRIDLPYEVNADEFEQEFDCKMHY